MAQSHNIKAVVIGQGLSYGYERKIRLSSLTAVAPSPLAGDSAEKKDGIYFITFTCYKWMPLIELTNSHDLVYKRFDYLKSKGHLFLTKCPIIKWFPGDLSDGFVCRGCGTRRVYKCAVFIIFPCLWP